MKNILSFILKESESVQNVPCETTNKNMLPQMSNFSPPNNEMFPKFESGKKSSLILKNVLKYLHEEIVVFYNNLSRRDKNKFLFKGFIIQLCRLFVPFKDRNHPVLTNNMHWKQLFQDFIYHEIKKEDKVLVEDPRKKDYELDSSIGLPANFKINDASLQGKMNLNTNYDSVGNQGMILDDDDDDDDEEDSPKKPILSDLSKHKKFSDSDSDSDSDSESDEDLLQTYTFGRKGDLLKPKVMNQVDADFSGYDSGVGKGVDLTEELEEAKGSTFTKEKRKSAYDLVNDWNIYGQGSWKALGEELDDTVDMKKYSSVKNTTCKKGKTHEIVSNSMDDESDNLQRHQITRKENKKYGLYGSLTRRFQITKKSVPISKTMNPMLNQFYDSANPYKKEGNSVKR
jgi:hypothetical protein